MNAKKAETLENTGEIIVILKGAACQICTAEGYRKKKFL